MEQVRRYISKTGYPAAVVFCFALLFSYGLWKRPELLGALAALCAAAVVLFVLLLCVNIYYEKRG